MTNAVRNEAAEAAKPVDPIALRKGLIDALVKADEEVVKVGEARMKFARYLEETLPVGWEDIGLSGSPAKDSNLKAMVRAERDAFVDGLKAKDYSNVDMAWKRLKEAALAVRKEAEKAKALVAHIAAGGTEEDFAKEETSGKTKRSPRERNIQDLGKLLKANVASLAAAGDSPCQDLREATDAIAVALRALGEKVDDVKLLIEKAAK